MEKNKCPKSKYDKLIVDINIEIIEFIIIKNEYIKKKTINKNTNELRCI